MPGCSPLQPLDALVERWVEEQEMDDGQEKADREPDHADDARIKAALHHEKRIPVAGSDYWGGANSDLDLAPGSKGAARQLTTCTSECDLAELGDSSRAALERCAAMLESGKLVWNAEAGVVPKGKKDWSENPAEDFAKMK